MQLAIRMLLQEVGADRVFRVVHLEPGLAWLHPVGETAWPIPSPIDKLVAGLVAGEWIPKAENMPSVPNTPVALERQERRYALVKPLLDAGKADLLMRTDRFALIKARVDELACEGVKTSSQHFSDLLRAWWDGGMTYDALATRYDRCGGPGQRRDNRGEKVGRPNTVASPDVGMNVTEGDWPRLEVGAAFFLKGRLTLAQAHRSVCLNFYSEFREDDAGRLRRVLLDARPSQRQLQYYITRNYPTTVRRRMRLGDHAYELADRAITGRADGDVNAPGDRYEIDATIADTYLVSAYDETRIVGRPVIYSVVDVFSRMVVGAYVGFEGPSWKGAMMALVNMMTDKVAFCAKYDIHIEPDEWPCHHAPVEIMADRGELMSDNLGQRIVRDLHVGISNVRPYRGDMKGIVERTHGTLQRTWGPFNPGYVKPDFGERGAIDYRKKGALTLHEFTKQHILAVLVHNAKPSTTHLPLPEMVSEELAAAPIDFWRWGVRNRGPRLQQLSVDHVAWAVMHRGRARVTARGIKFKGGYYDCGFAQRDSWYERARSGGTWEVEVCYDPGNLGRVYLQPDARTIQALDLLPAYGDLDGKSLFEFEENEAKRKRVEAAGEADRAVTMAEREEQMRRIGEDGSKRLAAKLKDNPDAGDRTKGIRRNRQVEKAAEARRETVAPATAGVAGRLPASRNPLDERRRKALARLKTNENGG
ncbi:Mu transposase C-terminal domain-containing protein [Lichenihabitans sp. Uapishka_5]|uniref:Mu transposase C-terminal domain-containing protein n=1 Tax=Lichenihabitans sp. Uapishka_5 TaxID=3037302 RepID=UPI0029E8078C|nr:Mu transposase C-terminal domain-containing protein [Lichenihabitans sp. Uapishka_5]MDX7951632.1 Mu transposase C-terminal domain-containing protein [Lichenihabitans sp. Uapishka_5]